MERKRFFAIALVPTFLVLAAACGNDGDEAGQTPTATAGGQTVQGTVKDFAIALDPSTASSGTVTFDVTNDGPSVHEFVVFRTDIAEGDLPLSEDGSTVDEEGATGIELIGELEDIEPGSTVSLEEQLDAGSYVIICNIPGHYGLGMHTSLTVS